MRDPHYQCILCDPSVDCETHEETGEDDNFQYAVRYVCDEHCINRQSVEAQAGSIFGCLHN